MAGQFKCQVRKEFILVAPSTDFCPLACESAQTSLFQLTSAHFASLSSTLIPPFSPVLFKNSYFPLQFNPLQAGFCTQVLKLLLLTSICLRVLCRKELNQLCLEEAEMGFMGNDVEQLPRMKGRLEKYA